MKRQRALITRVPKLPIVSSHARSNDASQHMRSRRKPSLTLVCSKKIRDKSEANVKPSETTNPDAAACTSSFYGSASCDVADCTETPVDNPDPAGKGQESSKTERSSGVVLVAETPVCRRRRQTAAQLLRVRSSKKIIPVSPGVYGQ